MQVERKSILTGATNTLEIEITHKQLDGYMKGHLTDEDLDHLSQDQLDFLFSGITPKEAGNLRLLYPNPESDLSDILSDMHSDEEDSFYTQVYRHDQEYAA